MFLFRSLRAKTLLWALLPMAAVLVIAAVIARFAYEGAARDVVVQRDTELARVSAARLSERLFIHTGDLLTVAADDSLRSMDLARLGLAVAEAGQRLNVFDAGIFVYDALGNIVWPPRPAISPPPVLAQPQLDILRRTLRPSVSDVYRSPQSGADLITILVPIVNRDNQFGGALAGVSNIRTSLLGATFAQVLELKAGESGFAYLVDSKGRVIHHRDNSQLGRDLTAVVAVARSIGGTTGAVISEDASGRETISGFAPVPGTGWALVTQERWSKVVGPIESRSFWLLLLLAGGGILSGALIFVAIGRTLGPIKQLTRSARQIAEGDFDHTITASSGDEIETLAEQFNVMAGALKESYAELENRVEARTGELRDSEELYRALFEESRDAIFISSLKGEFIDVNQATLDLFGLTREEIIGSDWGARYFDPEDRVRLWRALDEGGSVSNFEGKLLRSDGTAFDCEASVILRRDESGSKTQVQGIIRDVTQRKQADEMFKTLAHNTPVGIFLVQEGKFKFVNAQFEIDTGYSIEELLGRDSLALVAADDIQIVRERATNALKGSPPSSFEYRGISKTGEVRWILGSVSAIDFEGARALAGTYLDITEHKRAEEAVREAEGKYRSIFDESKDPIFVTSREGRVLDANQAAVDVFGYSMPELMDLAVRDMCEDPQEHTKLVQEVNASGSVKDYEIRLLRKDGSIADCVVSLSVQRDDEEKIVAYQGMVRDITMQKQAEEDALQQTREVAVLEERNRMAREIHDTMAQGFTGIVLQMEAAEQSMEGTSGELAEHLNRARNLAREGLQEARRSVWGLLPQALERLSLDAALQQELSRFEAEGQEKIGFSLSGKRRDLPADVQTVLFRICQESLTNIRRHAEASEVNVTLKYRPGNVYLSVQDNGVGFDPASVQREKNGFSFGLIGMKQRADQLDGQLQVDSIKGKGTLVELTVPTP